MKHASNPIVASFVMCSGVMLLTNTYSSCSCVHGEDHSQSIQTLDNEVDSASQLDTVVISNFCTVTKRY